jgi:endonuclease/exonuclease/phosphatase family metal-dependent hydrolase
MGEALDALNKAIAEDRTAHTWVIGDLNAATRGEHTGQADEWLKEMLQKYQLSKQGQGLATYRDKREIDHIIVGQHEAHTFVSAQVMPATVEESDHHVVHTTMVTMAGDDELGKQRPVGPGIKD